jgi:hypothetical protein
MPANNGDCRDCGKYSGELYMLRNKLWKSVRLGEPAVVHRGRHQQLAAHSY